MINPDRAELKLQFTSTPENQNKTKHIPSWTRVPVFTARTFLAVLTATPGVVAADAIYNTIKPSIVYADSDVVFSLDARRELPGLDTGIDLVVGQQINIKASGRAQFYNRPFPDCGGSSETDPDGNRYPKGLASCYPYLSPGGVIPNAPNGTLIARIGSDPWFSVGSHYTAIVESNGRLFFLYNDTRGWWYDNLGSYSITVNITGPRPTSTPDALDIQIAEKKVTLTTVAGEIEKEKQRREKENQARELDKTSTAVTSQLNALRTPLAIVDLVATSTPTLTAEQIRIKQEAGLLPTNTAIPRPPTPAPVPEIRPTQVVPSSSTPSKGIPDWLWGLGAASLAGLAAYWGYRSGKGKNPPSPPPPPPAPPPPGSRGPNPNTAPSTGPSTGPSQPKNPEWVIGQKEFARRWQGIKSKLPPVRAGDTGNEQGYILDRFKAGMNMIHEALLEDTANIPEVDTRVRAGIEYLISEIWPDNRIFKKFFDPQFNAGLLSPEDLAKIIYLPEKYRHLSVFTRAQRREIMTIRSGLLHALHPDLLKKDSDPKLKDSLDILLKQLNAAWPLINKLIS